MKYRPIWIIGLVTVLVIVIGGSAVLAHEPSEGRAGRSELRFLEGMIDHHQMALDMANDCLAKATTESVKSLCQNVITAQSREILTMRGWLLSWYGMDYQPMSMLPAGSQPGAPSSGGMMQGGMMGMMDGDMADGWGYGGHDEPNVRHDDPDVQHDADDAGRDDGRRRYGDGRDARWHDAR